LNQLNLDEVEDDVQFNAGENVEQSNDMIDEEDVAADFDADDEEKESNNETTSPP
jgi:hypothetical protein